MRTVLESKSSRWSAHSPFVLLRKHSSTVVIVVVVIVIITVDPTEERKGKQVSAIFEK